MSFLIGDKTFQLLAHGHQVTAPDLPGRGSNPILKRKVSLLIVLSYLLIPNKLTNNTAG
jgi:hypothetical protein